MYTSRLEPVGASCFSSHHQMSCAGVGPEMNKPNQVSSDHHAMSLAEESWSPGMMFEEMGEGGVARG